MVGSMLNLRVCTPPVECTFQKEWISVRQNGYPRKLAFGSESGHLYLCPFFSGTVS